jgi:hypothetical protein
MFRYRKMKKVVYLDMDGVAADFDAHIRQFYTELESLNKRINKK